MPGGSNEEDFSKIVKSYHTHSMMIRALSETLPSALALGTYSIEINKVLRVNS